MPLPSKVIAAVTRSYSHVGPSGLHTRTINETGFLDTSFLNRLPPLYANFLKSPLSVRHFPVKISSLSQMVQKLRLFKDSCNVISWHHFNPRKPYWLVSIFEDIWNSDIRFVAKCRLYRWLVTSPGGKLETQSFRSYLRKGHFRGFSKRPRK